MKIIEEKDKKYISDEKRDLDIFSKIKMLENKKLSKGDKEIIKLIKTQLDGSWRKYFINYLNESLEKYKI